MAHYKGLIEQDGEWQGFEADSDGDATPEMTGYDRVVREDGSEVKNDAYKKEEQQAEDSK